MDLWWVWVYYVYTPRSLRAVIAPEKWPWHRDPKRKEYSLTAPPFFRSYIVLWNFRLLISKNPGPTPLSLFCRDWFSRFIPWIPRSFRIGFRGIPLGPYVENGMSSWTWQFETTPWPIHLCTESICKSRGPIKKSYGQLQYTYTPLKINGWNMSSWRFGSDHFPF